MTECGFRIAVSNFMLSCQKCVGIICFWCGLLFVVGANGFTILSEDYSVIVTQGPNEASWTLLLIEVNDFDGPNDALELDCLRAETDNPTFVFVLDPNHDQYDVAATNMVVSAKLQGHPIEIEWYLASGFPFCYIDEYTIR